MVVERIKGSSMNQMNREGLTWLLGSTHRDGNRVGGVQGQV